MFFLCSYRDGDSTVSLLLCSNHELKEAIIESDAKNCVDDLVDSLNLDIVKSNWEYEAIVEDIITNCSTELHRLRISVRHINRIANKAAH